MQKLLSAARAADVTLTVYVWCYCLMQIRMWFGAKKREQSKKGGIFTDMKLVGALADRVQQHRLTVTHHLPEQIGVRLIT